MNSLSCAEHSPTLSKLINGLSSKDRTDLFAKYSLPPDSSCEYTAERILFEIETRGKLSDEDFYALILAAQHDEDAVPPHILDYIVPRKSASIKRKLRQLGILFTDPEGRLILPWELFFGKPVEKFGSDSLVTFLSRLSPEAVIHLLKSYGLERSSSYMLNSAKLNRYLITAAPRHLQEISETESHLLKTIMRRSRGYTSPRDMETYGPPPADLTVWLVSRSHNENPLKSLVKKGLLILSPETWPSSPYRIAIPDEMCGHLSEWFRDRVLLSNEEAHPSPEEGLKTRPPVENAGEVAKRLIVELFSRRIRITYSNTIHKVDWRRLTETLAPASTTSLYEGLGLLEELGMLEIRHKDSLKYYVPNTHSEQFLKRQERDLERYVLQCLEEKADRINGQDRGHPGNVQFSPKEVLSSLSRERFIPFLDVYLAWAGFPGNGELFQESIFTCMCRVFYYMGWIEEGKKEEESYVRLTKAGSEVVSGKEKPGKLQPMAEKPLLVQPNGKVIADPETDLQVLKTLSVMGDVVSVAPAYCFQLSPEKLKQSLCKQTTSEDPAAFLARFSRHSLPNTVERLISDVRSAIVEGSATATAGIIATTNPSDAASLARHKWASRFVAGYFDRYVVLRPNASVSYFVKKVEEYGFVLKQVNVAEFCNCQKPKQPDNAGGDSGSAEPSEPSEPQIDHKAVLSEASNSKNSVRVKYRSRKGHSPYRYFTGKVERVTAKNVLLRRKSGTSKRLPLSDVVRVSIKATRK